MHPFSLLYIAPRCFRSRNDWWANHIVRVKDERPKNGLIKLKCCSKTNKKKVEVCFLWAGDPPETAPTASCYLTKESSRSSVLIITSHIFTDLIVSLCICHSYLVPCSFLEVEYYCQQDINVCIGHLHWSLVLKAKLNSYFRHIFHLPPCKKSPSFWVRHMEVCPQFF